MSVLVLGASGQLARHLREVLQGARFWGRLECSLEDPGAAEVAIRKAAPSTIINAAAYTAVDKAEEEPAVAWRVNAEGAAVAARAAAELDIPLIHVSTDYVFDGESAKPYRETDPTRPLNVYGRTKLAGELAVASICQQYWILRVSWVFSEFEDNFVTTMLRLGNERDRLQVVADQRGRPTYAGDLARAIAALADGKSRKSLPWGIYHLSGGEPTSWHEFAERIIARGYEKGLVKDTPTVDAIRATDFPTRARRPMNSVLEPSRVLEEALEFKSDWRVGLEDVLNRLRSGSPQSLPSSGVAGGDLSDSAEAVALQTVGLHQQLSHIRRNGRIRFARRLDQLSIALGEPLVTTHTGGIIVRGVSFPASKAPPLLFRGGAYTNEQEIIAHSRTLRTADALCVVGANPTMPPKPVQHVSDQVLYGGFVFAHFGHLLLEGLARLWGARLLDHQLPIYVQCPGATLPPVASKVLQLAGLVDRVRVVSEDTSFDSVVVPAPAFVIQHRAHSVFKQMYLRLADRALGSSRVGTTDRPLYLSRSGLPLNARALMGESILEKILRRNGVKVIHPERLNLVEQIRLINKHRIVLGPIGTAFHLLLFSRRVNEVTYLCTNSPNPSYALCDVLNGTRADYLCVAARNPPFPHGRFARGAGYPEILNLDPCLDHLRERGYIKYSKFDRAQLEYLQQEHRRRFLHAALRDAQRHRDAALLNGAEEIIRRDYMNDPTLVEKLEAVTAMLNGRRA